MNTNIKAMSRTDIIEYANAMTSKHLGFVMAIVDAGYSVGKLYNRVNADKSTTLSFAVGFVGKDGHVWYGASVTNDLFHFDNTGHICYRITKFIIALARLKRSCEVTGSVVYPQTSGAGDNLELAIGLELAGMNVDNYHQDNTMKFGIPQFNISAIDVGSTTGAFIRCVNGEASYQSISLVKMMLDVAIQAQKKVRSAIIRITVGGGNLYIDYKHNVPGTDGLTHTVTMFNYMFADEHILVVDGRGRREVIKCGEFPDSDENIAMFTDIVIGRFAK